jgi:putative hydrolase of the HAD superfamily
MMAPKQKEALSDVVLILDLGNVVFPLAFEAFELWLSGLMRVDRATGMKQFMPIYLRYEKNELDSKAFIDEVRQLCDSGVSGAGFSDETFTEKWLSCWVEDTVGMDDALQKLKSDLKLVALSNTNALHINAFLKTKPILKHFEHVFCSHELGCSKPSPEIYEKVEAALACRPEQILFLDDKQENIDAALKKGWNASIFYDVPTMLVELERHADRLNGVSL